MNKKATIGTTMTWIIATILILLILLLLLIISAYLSKFGGIYLKADIENKENSGIIDTENLILFIEKNKGLISEFGDKETLDFNDPASEEKLSELCKKISEYKNILRLKNNMLYFSSEKNKFIAEENQGEIICRIPPPNEVVIGFDQQSIIKSEIYVISEKNNNIKIIYARK